MICTLNETINFLGKKNNIFNIWLVKIKNITVGQDQLDELQLDGLSLIFAKNMLFSWLIIRRVKSLQ